MAKPEKQDYQPYDPAQTEPEIYTLWEKSGYFNPDKLPDAKKRKKPFTITIAPPNITGSLHMGHALENTVSDIVVRQKRMEGYKTLWLPGTDHAGISTQVVVERQIAKEGQSRHQLGKEKFLEKVWEWKEKYGNIILDQLKKLGASLDWSRTRFTLDKEYVKAVELAFLHYYDKGWIYQGERLVNWCKRCGTSVSDLEIEHEQEKGTLWYIKYPVKGEREHIIVATTRPETMLGDAAVAVHPNDKRYKKFIGHQAILPITERTIPIIADTKVDPKFGTGAVKVTPAHDPLDFEIGQRHKLPMYRIIDERGRMTRQVGLLCQGMNIEQCRNQVLEELKKENLLLKTEQFEHNVTKCARCSTTIEPMLSTQWFLKMDTLAKMAKDAVKSKKVKIVPKKWEKTYFDWISNLHDWNISRQLWWGHKIPLPDSNDVLDTWFSSALWPFAALGWPNDCTEPKNKKFCVPKKNTDIAQYYPTQFITSARDILHLWITRMIFSGMEFMGTAPFQTVFIHPTILTKTGARMSKSKGTGIDPLELINKYGADATRFGLIWQMLGTQDVRFAEEPMQNGKKFVNKIWNAGRFLLMRMDNKNSLIVPSWPKKGNTKLDNEMMKKLQTLVENTDKKIAQCEFGSALHELYEFFWRQFADIYIEDVKKRDQDAVLKAFFIYSTMLKLLHPFIPFVTEAMYAKLPIKNKQLLMVEQWPSL